MHMRIRQGFFGHAAVEGFLLAAGSLAELRLLAGRQREAAGHIEDALQLYEQKGNVLSAERARSRLRGIQET